MTTETPSKSASTENRLAARQWVDAFNARDDEGEANARTADYLLCRGRHSTYYADRLNMPIKAVVSVHSRALADALSAYSGGKGRP
jgi:hypothetical protein